MKSRYANCAIVIPAYNEEENIGKILTEIMNLSLFEEIIVINDGSTDSTAAVLNGFAQVISIHNRVNMGNGFSVKKGILKSTKDYVVILDADGQHPAAAIRKLIDYAVENDYDLAVASRKDNNNISKFRDFGNSLLQAVAGYISGEKIEDLTSGFRVFKRSAVMKVLHLFPKRYSYPTASLLGLLALGYNVGYLRLPEITARQEGKSGLRPFRDFFRFSRVMLRIMVVFGPAKVFLPISVILFAMGISDIALTIYFQQNIQEFGVITILLSMIISVFALLGEQIARIRIEIGEVVSNEIRDRQDNH